MNRSIPDARSLSAPLHPRKLSRDTVFLVGDLLPLIDFASVWIAAWLAALAYVAWFAPGITLVELWSGSGRAALAAAVLAPLILCERAYVSFASRGQTAAVIRCYAVRFVMFIGVIAVIGLSSQSLSTLPPVWLGLWLLSTLAVTAWTRWLLVASLRSLERRGILSETVAVIGGGAQAQGLVDQLAQARGDRAQILGPYSDSADTRTSIAALLELGKTHHLDWILLAPIAPGDEDLHKLVHRLKSLAAPIGLCSAESTVTPIPGPHRTRWDAVLAAIAPVLPRWILTLLGLPLATLRWLRQPAATRVKDPATTGIQFSLDDYDLDQFVDVAARFGQERYGYVVTPNADHLIRLHREPSFRALYADAAYVLLDSRFVSKLLRLSRGLNLPVCTGSDLTGSLFSRVITPGDSLVLIGGSSAQAGALRARYGLQQLAHFNPPMGFIHDTQAVETCLKFIESNSPFRYCLLAVGAPQQEMLAQQLKARGRVLGLALCIGASVNFLTGDERRAPHWMQRSGLEWLFRLLQAPRRMTQRYLIRGPQLFGLLRKTEIVLRQATVAPTTVAQVSSVIATAPLPRDGVEKASRKRRVTVGSRAQRA